MNELEHSWNSKYKDMSEELGEMNSPLYALYDLSIQARKESGLFKGFHGHTTHMKWGRQNAIVCRTIFQDLESLNAILKFGIQIHKLFCFVIWLKATQVGDGSKFSCLINSVLFVQNN